MKLIQLFRYYGKDSDQNYPQNIMTEDNLTRHNIFDEYSSITHLGIQGRPGTKFFLNESLYSIVLGDTGIYELNLEGYGGDIHCICFDEYSLAKYDAPTNTDRLLIDIVYEGAGVKS